MHTPTHSTCVMSVSMIMCRMRAGSGSCMQHARPSMAATVISSSESESAVPGSTATVGERERLDARSTLKRACSTANSLLCGSYSADASVASIRSLRHSERMKVTLASRVSSDSRGSRSPLLKQHLTKSHTLSSTLSQKGKEGPSEKSAHILTDQQRAIMVDIRPAPTWLC